MQIKLSLGQEYQVTLQDKAVVTLIVHGASPGVVQFTLDSIYCEHPDIEFLHWSKIEGVKGIAT
ncbi:hypothetical protein [Xanthomonas campestris]|uniref:hypothetical protein n=1 Tax=Xanthomonas campestris TaxID=339 RepID=UPI00388E060F